jgi:hypothetical protein
MERGEEVVSYGNASHVLELLRKAGGYLKYEGYLLAIDSGRGVQVARKFRAAKNENRGSK